MEKISQEDVKHVAKLASLSLSEKEIELYTQQLSEVIDYNMGELKKVDTNKIEPITNITGLEDILAEDEVEPGLTQEEALANSKETHNGFFKVKAVL
ncbi:MAG: Asp-tRNA(Asn)/Glu-tRNA(Gln) amidotransferase subunit GatC [bacterium]|nr:Asp-tRNA(Asn)/Glu-tRNA(Gln) amidotransferase subunit GatC [bacterium]